VNVGKLLFHRPDLVERGGVVRVAADENMVVRVADGGDVVGHHLPDDFMLMPQGYEDGQCLLGFRFDGWPLWFRAEPEPQPEEVQQQIVDTAQEEPSHDAGKDKGYDGVQRR
jgi:hypothetical protein